MEHPEWKVLYTAAGKLIADGKTEFTYAELEGISGVSIQSQHGRRQFLRFRKECLQTLSVWFENDRGKGYRVVEARDHVTSATQRVVRARRMTKSALDIASNTRFGMLTDSEKTAALATQAAIGTLYLASKEVVTKTRKISGEMQHPRLYLPVKKESTV